MLAHIFRHVQNYASLEFGHWLVQDRPDDRYLVSYPRSGNTWVRTVIIYLLITDLTPEKMTDIREAMIPGVSIRQARLINQLASPRILKSHTRYRPDIRRAVYLVRDGRDVVISYYHYLVTREDNVKDISFVEFFDLYCRGAYGHLWHSNVESWLGQGRTEMTGQLLVVRYEDLKANPLTLFGQICQFLGIAASRQEIEQAIEMASLNKMRGIEAFRVGQQLDRNASFYRGGQTGEWENYFTPAINQQFLDLSACALKLAGYEL